jgi:Beta-propeller repeat
VYVTGFVWNGFGGLDYITIKYNSSGVQKWLQVNGGYVSYSVAVDGSGNVYVTGGGGNAGNLDYYTIKYDSSGITQWSKIYDGPGNSDDEAYSLALDDSGNVYVTGYSRSGTTAGTEDYATVKYNSSGVQKWVQRYNGPGNGSDYAYSIAVNGAGYVYITGASLGSGTGNDYATIKYSQTGSLLTLNLTAFIQGFYNSVSNNMRSDTARVCLKNNLSPYNTIDSSKGILSSSGGGTFLFSNAANGVNYFIEVKHRNSIETWSSSPITFSLGSSVYNFATVSTQAYGSNEIRVDLSPLRFAIYNGDVNQDGTVDLTDNQLIENDANNFVVGYIGTDLTGDNFVDVSDAAIADNNAFNFVSVIKP